MVDLAWDAATAETGCILVTILWDGAVDAGDTDGDIAQVRCTSNVGDRDMVVRFVGVWLLSHAPQDTPDETPSS